MEEISVKQIEEIARICHEVNKAYCEAVGDKSQAHWEDAPQWQRESAVEGVLFHIKNPDSKPEDSHQSWLDKKYVDGWSYGHTKNPAEKTHPCMVPFNRLPKDQQVKDFLFLGIVRAMS